MNELNETRNEEALLFKLFEKDHLNVPERNSLPKGMVRESIARKIILEHLRKYGWFPGQKQKPIGDPGGEYFQLEHGDYKSILHHNFEYSYLKFKHQTFKCKSATELITAYLKEKEKEGLDGLSINWGS